ncbi:hypothetical protein N2152v2_004047 [Parachlorella kessleri]
MEGNPIGVRTTPFGYEAFCSRDGEEDVVVNDPTPAEHWPQDILDGLRAWTWDEIVAYVMGSAAGDMEPNPDGADSAQVGSVGTAGEEYHEPPALADGGLAGAQTFRSEGADGKPSRSKALFLKGQGLWMSHGDNTIGRKLTSDVVKNGRLSVPVLITGHVLEFFGMKQQGGEVIFFHPPTGRRWPLVAKREPGRMAHFHSGLSSIARTLGLEAGDILLFSRQQDGVLTGNESVSQIPTVTVSGEVNPAGSGAEDEAAGHLSGTLSGLEAKVPASPVALPPPPQQQPQQAQQQLRQQGQPGRPAGREEEGDSSGDDQKDGRGLGGWKALTQAIGLKTGSIITLARDANTEAADAGAARGGAAATVAISFSTWGPGGCGSDRAAVAVQHGVNEGSGPAGAAGGAMPTSPTAACSMKRGIPSKAQQAQHGSGRDPRLALAAGWVAKSPRTGASPKKRGRTPKEQAGHQPSPQQRQQVQQHMRQAFEAARLGSADSVGTAAPPSNAAALGGAQAGPAALQLVGRPGERHGPAGDVAPAWTAGLATPAQQPGLASASPGGLAAHATAQAVATAAVLGSPAAAPAAAGAGPAQAGHVSTLHQMLGALKPLVEGCGAPAAACRAFLRLFINKMDDSTRAANYEMLVGMGHAAVIQEWVVDTVQDMQAGRQ